MTFLNSLLSEAKVTPEQFKKNTNSIFEKEIRFLELKAKKEISDRKNSPLRKYTLSILAAREFKSLEENKKAAEFYKQALEIKVEVDKKEAKDFLKDKKSSISNYSAYFFNSDLKELISSHQYEKAILSINPGSFVYKENENLRIVYDILQVKIKKQSVKKLYCLDNVDRELEGLNYESVLCEYLAEYLKLGKKDKGHLAYVEEFFFKNDLKERYLLSLLNDLN